MRKKKEKRQGNDPHCDHGEHNGIILLCKTQSTQSEGQGCSNAINKVCQVVKAEKRGRGNVDHGDREGASQK